MVNKLLISLREEAVSDARLLTGAMQLTQFTLLISQNESVTLERLSETVS